MITPARHDMKPLITPQASQGPGRLAVNAE
jgi:hypothetical protein